MLNDLSITYHKSHDLPSIEISIEKLYRASFAEKLDGAFRSAERFVDRVRNYADAPGFEFVTGRMGDQLVGLALGFPLQPGARWWTGLITPVEPDLIEEDGSRTFALCELMTHPDFQGEGLGHRLHDQLLLNRPERRTTLLVADENEAARRTYVRWGWQVVGTLRPGWADAPCFNVLILDLDQARGRS